MIREFALTASLGIGQPATAQRFGRNAGQVGLDVEDGSPVEHIHAADVHESAITSEELDNSQADGIRAPRRSRGENTVRTIIHRRRAEQFESFGAIKDPKDEQVREAFEVGEAEFKFGQDFEDAFGFVLGAGTFGDFFSLAVGSFGVANSDRCKHRARIYRMQAAKHLLSPLRGLIPEYIFGPD